MVLIDINTFTPYIFENKLDVLRYLNERSYGMRESLKVIEKDSEHLNIRCPLNGEYITILGDAIELEWVYDRLKVSELLREF